MRKTTKVNERALKTIFPTILIVYTVLGYRVPFCVILVGGVPQDFVNVKMCHTSKKVENHCCIGYSTDKLRNDERTADPTDK